MLPSTPTITADRRPLEPGESPLDCRAADVRIASALGSYEQSQSGFAILP